MPTMFMFCVYAFSRCLSPVCGSNVCFVHVLIMFANTSCASLLWWFAVHMSLVFVSSSFLDLLYAGWSCLFSTHVSSMFPFRIGLLICADCGRILFVFVFNLCAEQPCADCGPVFCSYVDLVLRSFHVLTAVVFRFKLK